MSRLSTFTADIYMIRVVIMSVYEVRLLLILPIYADGPGALGSAKWEVVFRCWGPLLGRWAFYFPIEILSVSKITSPPT